MEKKIPKKKVVLREDEETKRYWASIEASKKEVESWPEEKRALAGLPIDWAFRLAGLGPEHMRN